MHIGTVAAGRIGLDALRKMKPFDTHLHYFDRHRLPESVEKELNLTYVFISHDLNLVQSISDSIIVLKDGLVLEQGPTKKIFNSPKHYYTKNLLRASK